MFAPLLVSCALGFGSATPITETTFVSASHVFAGDRCEVAGRSIEIVYDDPVQDILIGRVTRPFDAPLAVSCARLETGKSYRLQGARDRGRAVATDQYYGVKTETAQTLDMRGMRGRAVPGMSGGAVLDDAGAIVGVISSEGENGIVAVREFATTQLCDL